MTTENHTTSANQARDRREEGGEKRWRCDVNMGVMRMSMSMSMSMSIWMSMLMLMSVWTSYDRNRSSRWWIWLADFLCFSCCLPVLVSVIPALRFWCLFDTLWHVWMNVNVLLIFGWWCFFSDSLLVVLFHWLSSPSSSSSWRLYICVSILLCASLSSLFYSN